MFKLAIMFLAVLPLSLPLFAQEVDPESESIEYSYDGSSSADEYVSVDDGKSILVEGDIAYVSSRSAGKADAVLWSKGVLVYEFQNRSSDFQAEVIAAMKEIESKTQLRFKRRTSEENFVSIGNTQKGCFSYFGKIGGAQTLNLEIPGCISKGVIMHELFHAFGILHEQSRNDRDKYVTIHEENMIPEMRSQFSVMRHTSNSEYDLDSIMHYGSNYFSRNNLPTMTLKSGALIKPNRTYLTKSDISGLNFLYRNELNGVEVRPSVKLDCSIEVPFYDKKEFDVGLRAKLALTSKSNTCIKFLNQTYTKNDLPDRLSKWFDAVQKTGGKVEYQEVSRGWLGKLIQWIVSVFNSDAVLNKVASNYNVLVQVDQGSQEVLTVIFYPRN